MNPYSYSLYKPREICKWLCDQVKIDHRNKTPFYTVSFVSFSLEVRHAIIVFDYTSTLVILASYNDRSGLDHYASPS